MESHTIPSSLYSTTHQGNLIPTELILTDDDEDDIYLTKEAAAIAGLDVRFKCLSTGEELYSYLRSKALDRSDPYRGLALVDINMPGMGGLAALERLKQDPVTRHIPIIIYSTSQAVEDIDRAYAYGANSYLVKPVEFDAMVDLMWRLNNYWIELVQFKLI